MKNIYRLLIFTLFIFGFSQAFGDESDECNNFSHPNKGKIYSTYDELMKENPDAARITDGCNGGIASYDENGKKVFAMTKMMCEKYGQWSATKYDDEKECEDKKNDKGTLQIPNPASVYCIEKGGILEMKKDEKGAMYGMCNFWNGESCTDWGFFRGECGKEYLEKQKQYVDKFVEVINKRDDKDKVINRIKKAVEKLTNEDNKVELYLKSILNEILKVLAN